MWENDADKRCVDIDFNNKEHINIITTLCERNTFYRTEVMLWLGLFKGLDRRFVQRSILARQAMIPRGLFARNGICVVGFILYNIDHKTKKHLTIDFLLVDHQDTNQKYGTRLLRACEERHLMTPRQHEFQIALDREFEKHTGITWTPAIHEEYRKLVETCRLFTLQKDADVRRNGRSDYEQVRYITTDIYRDQKLDKVVSFYTQNGFSDMNKISKLKDMCHCHPQLFQMARVGPGTEGRVTTSVESY